MRTIRRTAIALLVLAVAGAAGARAQGESTAAREAYFGAVAEFFQLPRSEVTILGDWRLGADEIPVVLFVARKAGVSPEALVALRRSGQGWGELVARYHLTAALFHVPLPDRAAAGVLSSCFDRYRTTPVERWSEITLSDPDIVGLVNLRVLAQTLRMSPEAVLEQSGQGAWHELYLRLLGDADPWPGLEWRE
ncbi:MAG TPA: hypothetical protein VJ997_13985 [Longimicrobiales bacterium]|nr:hypothetical protein [Longimicrobiales bacterium]